MCVYFHVCVYCRITGAPQTTTVTPTAPSVLSGPSAPDTPSQRPRAKGNLPKTGTLTSCPPRLGRTPGIFLSPHLCLRKRSTTAPSGAWAAPKHDSMPCRSRTSPARRPVPRAPNRPWFPRRSTWQTTGWRTIWRRSSRRKRGAFEWSTMGLAGMTAPPPPPPPHPPPWRSTAGTDTQLEALSAEVRAVSPHRARSAAFYLYCSYFFAFSLKVLQFLPRPAGVSLRERTEP